MREVLRRGRKPGRMVWSGIAAFATLAGAAAGVLLLGGWIADDKPEQQFAPLSRPDVPIEVKARAGDHAFSDDVSAPPGERIQIVTSIRNLGQMAGTDTVVRLRLPVGLQLVTGSCMTRTSKKMALRPCADNFADGGLSYRTVGGGAWAQYYIYARVSKEATRLPLIARGTVNSNETAELDDDARVHVNS